MPPWKPLKRRELIAALRRAGFVGPFSGGKHEFMVKGDVHLDHSEPSRRGLSVALLKLILRQAGISRREWERL